VTDILNDLFGEAPLPFPSGTASGCRQEKWRGTSGIAPCKSALRVTAPYFPPVSSSPQGIGLPMEEALHFWRQEFAPRTTPEAFNKEYAYNVRHNYGKEGGRKDYTPYSCVKMITATIGVVRRLTPPCRPAARRLPGHPPPGMASRLTVTVAPSAVAC